MKREYSPRRFGEYLKPPPEDPGESALRLS